MKKSIVSLFLLSALTIHAQVGINNSNPDASAELDVKSSTRGFLAPRMTGAQMTAIAAPAAGLAVYNTDSASYCIYNGSAWQAVLLTPASKWAASGTNIYNSNSGNVGIGTSTPSSKLHMDGGNLLVTGTDGAGPDIEVSGGGSRLFFVPQKGAFRAGTVTGSAWDAGNIGAYSAALGYETSASGAQSFAAGGYCSASAFGAIAIGSGAKANGESSVSLGTASTVDGIYAVGIGTALYATGDISVAIGLGSRARSFAEVAVGAYGTDYTPASTSGWNAADRAFVVGNGSSNTSRSDAFTVRKTGNTGINQSLPASTLEVNGAIAATVKSAQVAGTHNPDNTAEFWFYSSGTGSITLPTSSCTNRMYTIVNQTGASRTITTYKTLSGTTTNSLANGTSVSLVYDGSNWLQYK